jgi:hypothetical protein
MNVPNATKVFASDINHQKRNKKNAVGVVGL